MVRVRYPLILSVSLRYKVSSSWQNVNVAEKRLLASRQPGDTRFQIIPLSHCRFAADLASNGVEMNHFDHQMEQNFSLVASGRSGHDEEVSGSVLSHCFISGIEPWPNPTPPATSKCDTAGSDNH